MSVEGVGRNLAARMKGQDEGDLIATALAEPTCAGESLDGQSGTGPAPELAAAQQCAALCYRIVRKQVQILLITSRDTGRWLLPKGWPIEGLSLAQSAAREAREEGGVKGEPVEECVGYLTYTKLLADKTGFPCIMAVYPVRVQSLARRYPEMHQRRRKWATLDQAAKLLQEPEAHSLLASFAKHPLVQAKPTGRAKG